MFFRVFSAFIIYFLFCLIAYLVLLVCSRREKEKQNWTSYMRRTLFKYEENIALIYTPRKCRWLSCVENNCVSRQLMRRAFFGVAILCKALLGGAQTTTRSLIGQESISLHCSVGGKLKKSQANLFFNINRFGCFCLLFGDFIALSCVSSWLLQNNQQVVHGKRMVIAYNNKSAAAVGISWGVGKFQQQSSIDRYVWYVSSEASHWRRDVTSHHHHRRFCASGRKWALVDCPFSARAFHLSFFSSFSWEFAFSRDVQR